MRLLKELKDCERGNDIYIIASGKSVDFIPVAFFDGKVTLGVGNLFSTPYKCKYYVRKEHLGLPHALTFPGIHIVSRHDCGNFSGRRIPDNPDCYVFDHMSNDTALHLAELDTERIIVSWSTITSGIHLAYYMGAKNIILCGADCGQINGQSNFSTYDTSEGGGSAVNPEWYRKWLGMISPASEALAQELRKRGVGVMSINPWVNFQLEGNCYEAMR